VTEVTLLLLAAAGGFGASRATRLPAIPILILAGVSLTVLAPIPADALQDALVLGASMLVFVLGIDLSPARVAHYRKAALRVGLAQFSLLGVAGFFTSVLFGLSTIEALYFALALSASSTLVVTRIMKAREQVYEPVGRMVTGVLLLQDLLVILAIPVVTRLPGGPAAVATGVGATLVLVALAGVILRWFGPAVLSRFRNDEEVLLLLVLSILFAFVGLAATFDLPLASGAFLAGVSLSGFPVNGLIRGQLASLGDFFHALYFVALGAFLTAPSAVELAQGVLFVLLVLLVTPPLVTLVAERSGFSARPSITAGLLLSQTSEFSLVIGLQGVTLGQLSPGLFSVIALSTLATMVLTPFIARDRVVWRLMRYHPFRAPAGSAQEAPSGHVLLAGCGRSGLGLLEYLVIAPRPVVVIEDDPELVRLVRDGAIPAIRGDVSDVEVLEAAGARNAHVVISTIRRKEDNGPLLSLAKDVPVFVRAFNVSDAEWIASRGGRPVLFSEAAAEDFLEWYESEGPGALESPRGNT
jgi:Kef-type K+ transport system membrane component KefB